MLGCGRRREIRSCTLSLLCVRHVSIVKASVQVFAADISASAYTPGAVAVPSSALLVVVRFTVAIARVVCLGAAVPSRMSRFLFAAFIFLVLLAVGSVLFFLFWGEEAAWYFLEELVGNLFSAVINRFES